MQSDIALTVDSSVRAGEVLQTLRSAAGDDLEQIQLFDSYEGDQVGEGKKSLAFRMTFRADRTLKTEEVNSMRDGAVSAASTKHGAVLRGA